MGPDWGELSKVRYRDPRGDLYIDARARLLEIYCSMPFDERLSLGALILASEMERRALNDR